LFSALGVAVVLMVLAGALFAHQASQARASLVKAEAQAKVLQSHLAGGDHRGAQEALDELQREGKIRNHGVSVEKVEEARMALAYPNVRTVQIIFNVFRQKPVEEFFPLAEERNIGILARVPLASGLLSGKMSAERVFAEDDHRSFNREGEAFDRGETFSGVDFETGLETAEELKELVPEGHTLAQFALRWILMHPAVSCAIPGGKNPSQVEDNVAAVEMPPLPDEAMRRAREIYDRSIRPEVHHLW